MAGVGVLGKLAGVLGGNIGDAFTKVVGAFKVPPEQIEAHRFELEKIAAELQEKQLTAAQAEVEAASANIRAETTSGDKYTERSRPTFLYLVEFILGFNCIFVPCYQMATHQPLSILGLPHEMYW